jgi:hypothetical protein
MAHKIFHRFATPEAPHVKRSKHSIVPPMPYLPVILSLMIMSAQAATTRVFEGSCGAAQFRVSQINNGHPLDNTFTLFVVTSSGVREIFRGEDGGWFHAACLAAKDGKPVLVFQSYCGGSACVEGRYGAVEPTSQKLLLRPSPKNVENHQELSALLGFSAPHLGGYKMAFCCGE